MPGVMFLPNCKARVGSSEQRRNQEADFIVMYGGVWGVLEVDGPHHEGKAAADHRRDRPLHHHGAAAVQRYESLECFKDPDGVVLKFMALLKAKAK
jgi:very-short-patch-repair endonuclease